MIRYVIPAYRLQLYSLWWAGVQRGESRFTSQFGRLLDRDKSVTAAVHGLAVGDILSVAETRELFLRLAREHGCEECGLFLISIYSLLQEIMLLNQGIPTEAVLDHFRQIYDDFIVPGALYEIQLLTRLLQKQLIRDFELPKRKQKASVWSIAGKPGKVFASTLASLPEEGDGMTSDDKAVALVTKSSSAKPAFNAGKALGHLMCAMEAAENLLSQKVGVRQEERMRMHAKASSLLVMLHTLSRLSKQLFQSFPTS